MSRSRSSRSRRATRLAASSALARRRASLAPSDAARSARPAAISRPCRASAFAAAQRASSTSAARPDRSRRRTASCRSAALAASTSASASARRRAVFSASSSATRSRARTFTWVKSLRFKACARIGDATTISAGQNNPKRFLSRAYNRRGGGRWKGAPRRGRCDVATCSDTGASAAYPWIGRAFVTAQKAGGGDVHSARPGGAAPRQQARMGAAARAVAASKGGSRTEADGTPARDGDRRVAAVQPRPVIRASQSRVPGGRTRSRATASKADLQPGPPP